jgi:hypothetical protein
MTPRAPLLPMGEAGSRTAAVRRRPTVPLHRIHRHRAAPAVRVPIADAAPGLPAVTATGDAYTSTTVEDLMVEVLEGTTRHQVVTATRLR